MVQVTQLPEILQTPEIRGWYKILGDMFEEFKKFSRNAVDSCVLKSAGESALADLGENIGVPRGSLSMEVYRQKLLVYYNAFFLVPNLHNFADLIKNSMGYYPENISPGWLEGTPLTLSMDIIIPAGSSADLLQDLQAVFSLGHTLDATVMFEAYVHNVYTSNEVLTGIDSIHQDISRVMVGFKGRKISEFTGEYTHTGTITYL